MGVEIDRTTAGQRLTIRLDGERFGRLTVLRFAGQKRVASANPRTHRRWVHVWLCRCDHGGEGEPQEVMVRQTDLMTGHTQSCGCLNRERSGRQRKAGAARARWERFRRERRASVKVLWADWYDLLLETMQFRAVDRRLLGMRCKMGKVRLAELLDRAAPFVPTEIETTELALALNMRGAERLAFEAAAREARRRMDAYDLGKRNAGAPQWAVEMVEGKAVPA